MDVGSEGLIALASLCCGVYCNAKLPLSCFLRHSPYKIYQGCICSGLEGKALA